MTGRKGSRRGRVGKGNNNRAKNLAHEAYSTLRFRIVDSPRERRARQFQYQLQLLRQRQERLGLQRNSFQSELE